MDHGIDWLGDSEQGEELNDIVEGHKYGWPYVFADSKFNPQDEPPGGISMEEWAAQSTEPVALYTPHAAPMQLAWYTGEQFPAEYRGDAFVAMRGSWNRKPPSGYEVLRIRLRTASRSRSSHSSPGFSWRRRTAAGATSGAWPASPMAADGSLLLADDTNGVIYRISYKAAGRRPGKGPSRQTCGVGGARRTGGRTTRASSETVGPTRGGHRRGGRRHDRRHFARLRER